MIVHAKDLGDLTAALETVNAKFDNNVIWNRSPEYLGRDRQGRNKYRCTLRVRDSHGPGARLTIPWDGKQRHMISACRHVHGEFYDALPEGAMVEVSVRDGTRKISPGDPWHDFNIGSLYRPLYASEACECDGL